MVISYSQHLGMLAISIQKKLYYFLNQICGYFLQKEQKMFAKVIGGLLIGISLIGMENPQGKLAQPSKKTEKPALAYTNEDRDSIIAIVADLKQGHLLFPIADSVFRVSIKHALLDGKELAPKSASVDEAVTFALANLVRTIRHTCPKKDFLESIELLLEQMDDRYEEEAKPLMRSLDDFKGDSIDRVEAETNMQLAYTVAHYEQFNQKDLKNMVHLHKRAPEMLQEKLKALPKDTVQTWYTEFYER